MSNIAAVAQALALAVDLMDAAEALSSRAKAINAMIRDNGDKPLTPEQLDALRDKRLEMLAELAKAINERQARGGNARVAPPSGSDLFNPVPTGYVPRSQGG